jgi:soluble lytic murein transglycosylase
MFFPVFPLAKLAHILALWPLMHKGVFVHKRPSTRAIGRVFISNHKGPLLIKLSGAVNIIAALICLGTGAALAQKAAINPPVPGQIASPSAAFEREILAEKSPPFLKTVQSPGGQFAGLPGFSRQAKGLDFGHVGLGAEDLQHYRGVFTAIAIGDMATAKDYEKRLKDRRLLGHAQAARYLHKAYKADYAELEHWLRRFADHPQAQAIYRLAQKRAPKGAKNLPQPKVSNFVSWIAQGDEQETPREAEWVEAEELSISPDVARRQQRLLQEAERLMAGGKPLAAARRLAALGDAKPSAAASLAGGVIRELLYKGRISQARREAEPIIRRFKEHAPDALWYGGLAAWKLNQDDVAIAWFEMLSRSPYALAWQRAGAGYWGARSALRLGAKDKAQQFFESAAHYPRSFYGLMASRSLGISPGLDWELPNLTRAHWRALARYPAALRAIGLLQIGQNRLAEFELERVDGTGDFLVAQTMVVLAERGGLARLGWRLGSSLRKSDGTPYDRALYPLPHWRPLGGFPLEPALIFAFMRQESRFKPSAQSPAGARGVMQLMPQTARQVVKVAQLPQALSQDLDNPINNMTLGANYLRQLIEMPQIDGNLMLLIAAYNRGPGLVGKWRIAAQKAQDPLWFLETLPIAETRQHVRQVMSNFWLYQYRLGQTPESLDQLIEGEWPNLPEPGRFYRLENVPILANASLADEFSEKSYSPALLP